MVYMVNGSANKNISGFNPIKVPNYRVNSKIGQDFFSLKTN